MQLPHTFKVGLTRRPAEELYGYHRNIWTLTIWNIDNFTKIFFCYSILYGLSLAMVKISIVFLYKRIFRAQSRGIQYTIWATQLFNVFIFIIWLIGLFFACRPLDYYWSYASNVTGTCPDPIDGGLVYPILNILMDAWMLVLPMSQIWSMRLSSKSKLGVLIMFSLGLV